MDWKILFFKQTNKQTNSTLKKMKHFFFWVVQNIIIIIKRYSRTKKAHPFFHFFKIFSKENQCFLRLVNIIIIMFLDLNFFRCFFVNYVFIHVFLLLLLSIANFSLKNILKNHCLSSFLREFFSLHSKIYDFAQSQKTRKPEIILIDCFSFLSIVFFGLGLDLNLQIKC